MFHGSVNERLRVSELTLMERKILVGLANGLQSKELAAALDRSVPTIEGYVRLLCARFAARSRAQLVAYAIAAEVVTMTRVDGSLRIDH